MNKIYGKVAYVLAFAAFAAPWFYAYYVTVAAHKVVRLSAALSCPQNKVFLSRRLP